MNEPRKDELTEAEIEAAKRQAREDHVRAGGSDPSDPNARERLAQRDMAERVSNAWKQPTAQTRADQKPAPRTEREAYDQMVERNRAAWGSK